MYKLVAADMDGTLLNEKHTLNKKTIDTIQKIKKLGVKLVLVSGRGFNKLKYFENELNIRDFAICLNGVNLYKDKELISGQHMEDDMLYDVLHICEGKDVYPILFGDDEKVYVDKIIENYSSIEPYIGEAKAVGELTKFCRHNKIYKITVFGEHEKLVKVENEVRNKFKYNINAYFSLPQYLEIFSSKVNKGKMLQKVAEYCNIKREEIIAIGDWDNDIPMLKYAGLGIAMDNGSKATKEAADYITKSNVEDGAAYALEKFILNV
ncbi:MULTISPECIES: Cof-type HAD-IIB family hydrolase [Clostridium]|uniref:Sugar phosphatase YidA n=1 Tax=Clostridium ragsdalei P11 TaxID=1353534 RepID=A0A1A6AWB6_9CLOT|nr:MULTISPECIES: Cof-type HAD-IIB family hydrolase [Clostridium]OBR94325.1 sugar phosphatase YidA [Clostridium ragsdalei P11]QXE18420.1 hypothetical protein B5S50_05960 [Clostridium sp. 001]